MRIILLSLAVAGTVAACAANEPKEVNSAPPTISYRLNGNDVAQTHAKAADYCSRYGLSPSLQAVQPDGSGANVAHYVCTGADGVSASPRRYPYATSPQGQVKCADWMHQGRPGGSDYNGPPVPGCS